MLEGGGSNTLAAAMAFLGVGGSVMLAHRYYQDHHYKYNPVCRGLPDEIIPQIRPPPPPQSRLRKPFVSFTVCLIVGSLFLPAQPWRQMTSTLLVDIVRNVIPVVISKTIRNKATCSGPTNFLGSNPLGNSNYNPRTDPYYISNLESPIDEFIVEALDGVKFKNIVHIVLESVRSDSFPFQEESVFAEYIKSHFPPYPNGAAMTIDNITPFIESIAENTISWETMWSVVPFSHKALMGRIPPSFNQV